MPVSIEIEIECDNCGDTIDPDSRYSSGEAYCNDCYTGLNTTIEDLQSDIDGMKDEKDELEYIITSLEQDINLLELKLIERQEDTVS